jgi:hypothetical protein
MNLQKMIDWASHSAEKYFQKHGCVAPVWFAEKSDGDVFIIDQPSADKDLSRALVRALFELHDVVRFVFFDEAWAVATKEDIRAWSKEHSLEHYPGREEVIIFVAEDVSGETVLAERKISQPGRELGPLEVKDLPRMEGRLFGMLPQRGRTQ